MGWARPQRTAENGLQPDRRKKRNEDGIFKKNPHPLQEKIGDAAQCPAQGHAALDLGRGGCLMGGKIGHGPVK